ALLAQLGRGRGCARAAVLGLWIAPDLLHSQDPRGAGSAHRTGERSYGAERVRRQVDPGVEGDAELDLAGEEEFENRWRIQVEPPLRQDCVEAQLVRQPVRACHLLHEQE